MEWLRLVILVMLCYFLFQVVLENSGRADKHDCPFVQASMKLTKILCDFLKIGEARKSASCLCFPFTCHLTAVSGKKNEPSHEIMVLFVLCKLSLQTRMHSHPVGIDVWFLVRPFVYFQTTCVRTAKALARLRGCTGSPEPWLVDYVISIIISWAGSYWDSNFVECTTSFYITYW